MDYCACDGLHIERIPTCFRELNYSAEKQHNQCWTAPDMHLLILISTDVLKHLNENEIFKSIVSKWPAEVFTCCFENIHYHLRTGPRRKLVNDP